MAMQDDLKLILRRSGKYVFYYDIRSGSAGELVDAFYLLGLPKRVENFEERLIQSGIVSGECTESWRGFLRRVRGGKPEESIELKLKCACGESWYHMDSTTVFEGGRPRRAIISFYECAGQNQGEHAQLMESAARDSMTGLLNHAAMEQRVEAQLNYSTAAHRALLMIDVDNFKEINDTLGHQSGDEALIRVAGTIRGSFRDSDLVGRIGGDEFMVFIPNGIDPASIKRKANELRRALSFPIGILRLTVSIGVTLSNKKTSFRELYGEADRALYQAKRKGKNTVCFFSCE